MNGQLTIDVTGGEVCSPVVPLFSDADPTGATVSFGVSPDASTAPSSYTAGSWSGTWTSAQLPVYARTPTLGASATIPLTAGSSYVLWCKVVSVGSETFAGKWSVRAT